MATPKAAVRARAVGKRSISARAGLVFPVGRISTMLRRGRYTARTSVGAGCFMAAVLEYLVSEMLEMASKVVAQSKKKTKRVSPRALTLGVRSDAELGALLQHVTLARGGVLPTSTKALEKKKKKTAGKRGKKARRSGSQRA